MDRRSPSRVTTWADFDLALAQGKLLGADGAESVQGFPVQGRHAGAQVAEQAVHRSSSAAFYLPSSVDTYRVAAGGDADDDAAGAGARTVELLGIDSNLELARETLTLAGASASAASSTSFWRVFRAEVATVGTYGGTNAGDVVVESVTGSNEALRIAAGVGETESALFCTPANRAGFVRNLVVHHEGLTTDPAGISLYLRERFNAADGAVRRLRRYGGFTRLENHPLRSQWIIPPLSDFWATVDAAAGTPPMLVAFDVTLAPLYRSAT